MPPEYLLKRVQNQFASINPAIPMYNGEVSNEKRVFTYLSADDKSGFDSCVLSIFSALFIVCALGPKFSEKERRILKYTMSDFFVTGIITHRGYEIFSELVPSGHTFTNACDSFACEVTAIYASILTGGLNISQLESEFIKYDTGDVEAGDDLAQPVTKSATLPKLSEAYGSLGFKMHPTKGVYSPYMTEFMGFTFLGKHHFINMPLIGENSMLYNENRHTPSYFMPVGRLMGNIVFAESHSPYYHTMIGELAVLDRVKNYSYAPYFNSGLYQFSLKHSDFNLCVEPVDYVPLWNQPKAFKRLKENKNADISDLTIKVENQYQMAQTASAEAEYVKDSIIRITDKV